MLKKSILFFFLTLLINCVSAQTQYNRDSLWTIVNEGEQDTNEVNALNLLANNQPNVDSLNILAKRALSLSRKLNYTKGEADYLLINTRIDALNFNQVIVGLLRALYLYESVNDATGIAEANLGLQGNYRNSGDNRNALNHGFAGEQVALKNHSIGKFAFPGLELAPLFQAEISKSYFELHEYDSALVYAKKSIAANLLLHGTQWNFPVYLVGKIETEQHNYKSALSNFRIALPLALQNDFPRDTLQIFSGISTLYLKTGNLDSAIYYARNVVNNWTGDAELEIQILMEALNNLTNSYKIKGNKDSTLKFMELSSLLKDSIYGKEKILELQQLTFNEVQRREEIAAAQMQYRNKIRTYLLTGGFIVLFLVASFLYRNNQLRRKAYTLLEKQNHEIDSQREKIEKTLDELKATQTQLIQSAKMASLGELTAGIAHEIQNPLNFVNNFSDVNDELIEEMKSALQADNTQSAISIANDIQENERKINHHGKRADAIVKSMLQHSRSTAGQKRPTDINALADEYLRLSYHGLRATNKLFNASMQTNFDKHIAKLNVVSEDIGRVFLNLYNNAFYAMMEKSEKAGGTYNPVIQVITKKLDGKVEIRVKDNGTGISAKPIDKIFQPFFTTKPAGKGTGLGLSLSYDIIVKEHGGSITIETKEGEYSEFIVQLLANHD